MAEPFGGIDKTRVFSGAQSRLMTLRAALEGVENYYRWISAYTSAELQTAFTIDAGDADMLITAFRDARQLYLAYNGTAMDSGYVLPYNFSATQRMIIGPQL